MGAALVALAGWLAVGGALAMLYGNPGAGPVYDAVLHAVFVGFIFSMIFGHAPIIFPSVLGIPIPYQPSFYGHVILLHAALLARTIGDLSLNLTLRTWGGWGNAAAIVLFSVSTVTSVVRGVMKGAEAVSGPVRRLDLGDAPAGPGASGANAEEVPDLDLSATDP